jgi:hypothetical protein
MHNSSVARRKYFYVDETSGNMVYFEASSDNEGAKDRVIRSLRYRKADTQLGNRVQSTPLDQREIIELYDLTMEGFERTHKILRQNVNYNFLRQISDLGQLPDPSAPSIGRLLEKIRNERIFYYEKRYSEDPEWQVCKEVSAFVDHLLRKRNEKIKQEIVAIAQREGFMRPKSIFRSILSWF